MQLVLISGLSGSGKSIALDVLEDSGHYVVDNLPGRLLFALLDTLAERGTERVAVSVDVRSGEGLDQLPEVGRALRMRGAMDLRVLFLDAATPTLVKRYSETRRRHPLSDGARTLPECIELERDLLAPLREIAHVIDTTSLAPNTLRTWVKQFVEVGAEAGITLLFQSFGFKHGVPLDADYVFDVRCLPNPYWDPALRPLTGRDAPVARFLEAEADVREMRDDIQRFVARWLPAFDRDNRSYMTVAVGCTGGQHRSVWIAESLAAAFRGSRHALVRHRELGSGDPAPAAR
ncbi:MAG: RNase adapter RapZ [Burkholderiales bacterium]|nr:RNase adapter RapZ [Burkholderiales bacterium]